MDETTGTRTEAAQPAIAMSPVWLMILLSVAVFAFEILLMELFRRFPQLSDEIKTFLDAGLLTLLLFPVLYFLMLRPINRQIAEREREAKTRRESEEQFGIIVSSAPSAIVMVNDERDIELWNPAAEKLFGYRAEEAIGKKMQGLIVPERFHTDEQRGFEKLRKTGEGLLLGKVLELPALHKDGTEFIAEHAISAIRLGDKWHAIGIMQDVTERKSAEDRMRILIESDIDGKLLVGSEGTIRFANLSAEAMLGRAREQLLGLPFGLPLVSGKFTEIELLRGCDPVAAEMHVTRIGWEGDSAYLVSLHDITERKEAEEKLHHAAGHDALTGLPNRKLFYDRLKQEIRKAHRDRRKMALLFLDLDHFKEINDTLGHSAGDALLVEAARRLGGCVRESDTVARLGGDEFTVILSELNDASDVERVAGNILQKLAEPFRLQNQEAFVSASVGITLYPDNATTMEDLLKDADQAMYAAKSGGRNRFSRFISEPAISD